MQSTLYTLSLYMDHDVKVVAAARLRYKKKTEAQMIRSDQARLQHQTHRSWRTLTTILTPAL